MPMLLAMVTSALALASSSSSPATDDPPQPRFTGAWPPTLDVPVAALDPHKYPLGQLPTSVPLNDGHVSGDSGLAANATPTYHIWAEIPYSFGLGAIDGTAADARRGVAATQAVVFAAMYSSNNVRRFDTGSGPLSRRLGADTLVSPRSEFFGLGGSFLVAADAATDTLYLSYDGIPAGTGLVRALYANGTERVALTNLTTTKQIVVGGDGRVFVAEEGKMRVMVWDPRVCATNADPAPGCWSMVVGPDDIACPPPGGCPGLEGIAVDPQTGNVFFQLAEGPATARPTSVAAVLSRARCWKPGR